MKIKCLSILMAMALCVSLAACGGSAGGNAAAPSEAAPSDSAQPAADADATASGKVMLYSSLKEAQLDALKEAFTKKYPNVQLDYYAAGTSKVATKLASEQQAGQIACDLIWVGDSSNYITFKEQGILEPYASPEAENIDAAFKDPDNMFTGGRLVVMGFGYNTNSVSDAEVPKSWNDLLNDTFDKQIVMTDPGESGTTFYAVAALMGNEKYGMDFFKALKEQGVELESGTTSTHTKVAASAYKVCLAVDYVTETLAKDGSPIKFAYPTEDLVTISSPIALVKGSKNQENGKLLYDFILSVEGQTILADNECTPIRSDVTKADALSIEEIVSRSMKVDDAYVSKNGDKVLSDFDSLFK